MSNLKPCPFCGEEKDLRIEHSDYYIFGLCMKCSCHGPELDRDDFESEDEEVRETTEAWNERGD